MKSKTFQGTDLEQLDKEVNTFDAAKNCKFSQHSTCYDVSQQAVVTTIRMIYEDK